LGFTLFCSGAIGIAALKLDYASSANYYTVDISFYGDVKSIL